MPSAPVKVSGADTVERWKVVSTEREVYRGRKVWEWEGTVDVQVDTQFSGLG